MYQKLKTQYQNIFITFWASSERCIYSINEWV